jgi:hypothetical protein
VSIVYCDFCGDVIPPESGDRVHLGEPESYPGRRLDACSKCFSALWDLVKRKNLRAKAALPAQPDKPKGDVL